MANQRQVFIIFYLILVDDRCVQVFTVQNWCAEKVHFAFILFFSSRVENVASFRPTLRRLSGYFAPQRQPLPILSHLPFIHSFSVLFFVILLVSFLFFPFCVLTIRIIHLWGTIQPLEDFTMLQVPVSLPSSSLTAFF